MDSVLLCLAAIFGSSLTAAFVVLRERVRDRQVEDVIRARMQALGVGATAMDAAERTPRQPAPPDWTLAEPSFGRRLPALLRVQTL